MVFSYKALLIHMFHEEIIKIFYWYLIKSGAMHEGSNSLHIFFVYSGRLVRLNIIFNIKRFCNHAGKTMIWQLGCTGWSVCTITISIYPEGTFLYGVAQIANDVHVFSQGCHSVSNSTSTRGPENTVYIVGGRWNPIQIKRNPGGKLHWRKYFDDLEQFRGSETGSSIFEFGHFHYC